ncbi:TPA: 3'-5' exonuclease [Vibrio parahaemolyticus]
MLFSLIDRKKLSVIERCCDVDSVSAIRKAFSNVNVPETNGLLELVRLIYAFEHSPNTKDLKGVRYNVDTKPIVVISAQKDLGDAFQEIIKFKYIGFDTEQKPLFGKNSNPRPISIIQIATPEKCYIFQLNYLKDIHLLQKIIESQEILKVGLDLDNDRQGLSVHNEITMRSTFDLLDFFAKFGFKQQIGIKKALWVFTDKVMDKATSVSKSDWNVKALKDRQISYAAEDANAILDILDEIRFTHTYLIPLLPQKVRFALELCE